jgi:D-alanine-D-alanine ligase
MGGWSAEREVSLVSGAGVADAVEALGWRATRVDMDRSVAAAIAEIAPDVVFNALHGTPGEDGAVQGMLDLMDMPYTHSGMATSVIAIDKELTKQALVPHGIRMPEGRIVESHTLFYEDPMPRPYVLKPVNEGSSVGVAIVTDVSNYGSPIARDSAGPWVDFDRLLAEPFIRGRELTVAVLDGEALAVTELRPKSGFYDYDSKYTDGMTEHVCPAEIPENVAAERCAWRRRRTASWGAAECRGPTFAGTITVGRSACTCWRSTPAGDDAAQPRSRTSARAGDRLSRTGAAHRRGGVAAPADVSQAARIRRGPAAQPRSRAVVTRPKAAARKAGGTAGRLLGPAALAARFRPAVTRWGLWLIAVALVIGLTVAFKLPQMAGTAAGRRSGAPALRSSRSRLRVSGAGGSSRCGPSSRIRKPAPCRWSTWTRSARRR